MRARGKVLHINVCCFAKSMRSIGSNKQLFWYSQTAGSQYPRRSKISEIKGDNAIKIRTQKHKDTKTLITKMQLAGSMYE